MGVTSSQPRTQAGPEYLGLIDGNRQKSNDQVAGEDPQLDFAISHMLSEIKKNGYSNPKRPEGPNRKGMGVKPEDK